LTACKAVAKDCELFVELSRASLILSPTKSVKQENMSKIPQAETRTGEKASVVRENTAKMPINMVATAFSDPILTNFWPMFFRPDFHRGSLILDEIDPKLNFYILNFRVKRLNKAVFFSKSVQDQYTTFCLYFPLVEFFFGQVGLPRGLIPFIMSLMEHLTGLNREQKAAVLCTDGPVIIVAGAGAGKTKTITHRILHLALSGIRPENILAITFTNKAAKEMRERVNDLLSKHRPSLNFHSLPHVSTFHSLGVKIIKDNAPLLGLPRHFSIYDKSDSKSTLKEAFKKIGYDHKEHLEKIQAIISAEKGRGNSVSDYLERGSYDFTSELAKKIWTEYEKILTRNSALDFDDLLLKTLKLLKAKPEILNRYREKFVYIHVDEYQDTNGVQDEIVELLAGNNKNVCVVGDVDQNIYGWRGAEIKNMLRFDKKYPGAKTFFLEQNYRSTKNILEAANEVIKKNTVRLPKNLFTENPDGEKISVFRSINELDEALTVSIKCKELIEKNIPSEEIAVLFRTNFQSRVMEEAFISVGIPYQMLGTRFFERKEIKDTMAFIRLSLNPKSFGDMERIINVPPRGLGKSSVEKISSGNEELLPPSAKLKLQKFREMLSDFKNYLENEKLSSAVKKIIVESGMEKMYSTDSEDDTDRLENLGELVSLATEYENEDLPVEETMEKFLTDSSLLGDQDSLDNNKNGVRLMTIHSAKGLEFDQVFISGLEQGLFPHQSLNKSKKTEDEEEERRLFYVALTRARKKLYLSWAETRKIFGTTQVNVPSEFLSDIPNDIIENAKSEEKPLFRIDF
jgi:DNA helicase-2/ATP-dependent DNA helicase PcrA